MNKQILRLISTFCFILFLLLSNITSYSLSKYKILRLERESREYFDNFKYHKALKIYEKLLQESPNNLDYIYRLAVCYINIDNNIEALPLFKRCIVANNDNQFPIALYFYTGRAMHLSHQFVNAIEMFNKYKSYITSPDENEALLKSVNREIKECENGLELFKNPLSIEIQNMGPKINSQYPDYGISISADENELIFTSNRKDTKGGKIDKTDGLYYEDIYYSTKSDTGWSKAKNMGDSINTSGHDASVSMTPDGNKLIIYRYTKGSSGNLMVSQQKNGRWSIPVFLNEKINTNNWEPSACFSSDEETLIFASNKPDGLGGTDLYKIKRLKNGLWSTPLTLGFTINTEYDEDSPYLMPDGKTLYFSSTGHGTMGGFDIFKSVYNEETKDWGKPQNVGFPVNTAHHDLHFSVSTNGKRIYFSSTRPEGFGGKDIYKADLISDAAKVLVMKGVLIDTVTNQPIEAEIKLLDRNTKEVLGVFNSRKETGKYLIIFNEGHDYILSITAKNYKECQKSITVDQPRYYKEMTKNIYLCPAE